MKAEGGWTVGGPEVEVEIGGRRVRLTSLDRVLWPRTGFTKGDAIDYYLRVAPVLVPHVARRPMTLARFPEGIEGPGWYQTKCPHPPPWIGTEHVPSPRGGRGGRTYCLLDEPAALAWAVNLGGIELHPLLARVPDLGRPTLLTFDLDPGPPAGIREAASVALLLRDLLAGLGLACLPKTSGAHGLHVLVPLNTAQTYADTKAFARAVARTLAAAHPDRVVDRPAKALREGRVLVDWSQNDFSRSLAAAYSLRARPRPQVSTPVSWEEVEAAAGGGTPEVLAFGPGVVLDRIARWGDLHAPALTLEQEVPRAGRR